VGFCFIRVEMTYMERDDLRSRGTAPLLLHWPEVVNHRILITPSCSGLANSGSPVTNSDCLVWASATAKASA